MSSLGRRAARRVTVQMNFRIKNEKDFGAALLFALVGCTVLFTAWDYDFGSLRALGPGAFPKVLGWFLVVLGLFMLAGSLRREGERIEPSAPANLAAVIGALVLFGLSLEYLGVLAASFALVFVIGVLTRQLSPLQAGVFALLVAVFVSVVFVWILGLQMPLLGSWFA